MTLRSSDLQSDSDLDSIRNSCDVLNGTEEDIGEAHGANVELISESAEQKQHDTMWQSAEISKIVSGPFIQLHQY